MQRKTLLILVVILVFIVGFIAFIGREYQLAKENNLTSGESKVLLLCADPSEKRPGMGGVDMAFIIDVKDGKAVKTTPIYPGSMVHPTATPPSDLAQYAGSRYYLHDALWDANPEKGAKLAQEIVEYNTGVKTNIVAIINPQAVDAIIQAVGPIYVPGEGQVTGNSINFLRDEQGGGMSRGNAVESLMDGIKNASQEKSKRSSLINTVGIEYVKGNIVVVPRDAFIQFMVANGIEKLF